VHERAKARNCSGLDLELAQEIQDLGLAPLHRADKLPANDPVAIDDVGFRPLESAVEVAGFLVRITYGWEVYLVVFQELMVGIAVNVHTNSQDSYAFVFEALLQLHQRGHFLDTRRAPRSPEVEEYDLPVEVAQGDLAVGVLDRELGSGGADSRWPGAAIAAGQQNDKDDGENRGASHKAIIPNSGYGGARSSIGAADGVGNRAGA
jgi:hypothetical protein